MSRQGRRLQSTNSHVLKNDFPALRGIAWNFRAHVGRLHDDGIASGRFGRDLTIACATSWMTRQQFSPFVSGKNAVARTDFFLRHPTRPPLVSSGTPRFLLRWRGPRHHPSRRPSSRRRPTHRPSPSPLPRIFAPSLSSSLSEYSQGQGVWCGGLAALVVRFSTHSSIELLSIGLHRRHLRRRSDPRWASAAPRSISSASMHPSTGCWTSWAASSYVARRDTAIRRKKKGRPPPSTVEPRARMQDRDAIGERNRRTETIVPTPGPEGKRKSERVFEAWGFETTDRVWPGCLGEKEPAKEARRTTY